MGSSSSKPEHPGPFGSFAKHRDPKDSNRARMPVALKQLRLTDDLLAYLQAIPIFCLSEADLEKQGFARCVDHPGVPKHLYYEGYFHGLGSPSPEPSINPRKGFMMDKPACDRRLRAFIAAFKKLNDGWLQQCVTGKDQASLFFKRLMDRGWHFADVAVQVHAGDHVDEKNIGWHNDAPNSTLHLALSIRGKRALHSRLADGKTDEEMKLQIHPQESGDVYVSSPFAFPHGVEYHEAKTWEDRIIAVQIRFLLTEDDYFNMRESYMDLATCMERVTSSLEKSNVLIPTLQQVHEAEKELLEAEPYVYVPPVAKTGRGLYDTASTTSSAELPPSEVDETLAAVEALPNE